MTDQEKQDITSKMDVAKREDRTDWKGPQGHEDEDPVECMIVDNKIVDKKVIMRKASIVSKHFKTNFNVLSPPQYLKFLIHL